MGAASRFRHRLFCLPPTLAASSRIYRAFRVDRRLPSGSVELEAVWISGPSSQGPPAFRFLPTGTVDPPHAVRIWLAVGQGDGRWYLPVDVDPATGRAAVGDVQRDPPGPIPAMQSSATTN